MITVKQQEKLIDRIKGLSELELDGFLEELSSHIRKNNLIHLIDSNFNLNDHAAELEDLERDYRDLETEKDKLVDDLFDINSLCKRAEDIEEFEEGAFDELKSIIKEIESKT